MAKFFEYSILNNKVQEKNVSQLDDKENELSVVIFDAHGNYQHSYHWSALGFTNYLFDNEWLDESIYELFRMYGTDERLVLNFIYSIINNWQVTILERTIYLEFSKSIKQDIYQFYITKLAYLGFINGKNIIQFNIENSN